MATKMEWFGYASALLFTLGYIPQLVRTYRLKTVDDLSVWMWVLTLSAYLTGLVYGVSLGKAPLILSYSAGLYCTLMILLMCYKYRDPRKDMIRQIVRDLLRQVRKK